VISRRARTMEPGLRFNKVGLSIAIRNLPEGTQHDVTTPFQGVPPCGFVLSPFLGFVARVGREPNRWPPGLFSVALPAQDRV
jgi:hypothetical protein